MRRLPAVVALGAAAAITLAGCSSSSKSSAPPAGGGPSGAGSGAASGAPAGSGSSSAPALTGSITVLAASSLTGSFNTIATQFEAANPGTKVTFSFGSSGALATQIDQGAPGDIFASAAPKNMQSVVSAGNATSSTNFVSNTLEIAVPPNNPGHVTQLSDLGKSSLKVAICVSSAPCGATALTVFKNANLTVKPATTEPDVKTTLAQVTSGQADAGVVYVTDVLASGTKVKGITIPASVNAITQYPIAVLKQTKNPTLAAAFVAYVQSSAGQAVLKAAGFAPPSA